MTPTPQSQRGEDSARDGFTDGELQACLKLIDETREQLDLLLDPGKRFGELITEGPQRIIVEVFDNFLQTFGYADDTQLVNRTLALALAHRIGPAPDTGPLERHLLGPLERGLRDDASWETNLFRGDGSQQQARVDVVRDSPGRLRFRLTPRDAPLIASADEMLVIVIKTGTGGGGGLILAANDAACTALKYTRTELVGSYYETMLHPGEPPSSQARPDEVAQCTRVAMERSSEILEFNEHWIAKDEERLELRSRLQWSPDLGGCFTVRATRTVLGDAMSVRTAARYATVLLLGFFSYAMLDYLSDGQLDGIVHFCAKAISNLFGSG